MIRKEGERETPKKIETSVPGRRTHGVQRPRGRKELTVFQELREWQCGWHRGSGQETVMR